MKKVLSFLFLVAASMMCVPNDPLLGIGCAMTLIVLCYHVLPAMGVKLYTKRTWYDNLAGSVNVIEENGSLGGTLQTNDGICGLVITGLIEVGDYSLGTPIMITSLPDLIAAGITEAGNPFAYKHVREFYLQAGSGARLYLMLVPNTMTVDLMADVTNPDGAIKLLNYSHGSIKTLGLITNPVDVGLTTIAEGLEEVVYDAVTNAEALAEEFFNQHNPLRIIIGATGYTDVAADLREINTMTCNRVGVLLGDTVVGDPDEGTNAAAMGLLLGTKASIPVQRKISRVRTGALPINAVYLGSNALETVAAAAAVIAGKGFITFTSYANVSGYFFSGDPMCVATTDDYCMLARGSVIDKVHRLAYSTFVQEVDDEVPVNADGTLDAGFCKWLSQQIVNQINNTMTASKEISAVSCFIDPAQNILSTNKLNIVLKVVPVGYATQIEVRIGFDNPALAA